MGLILASAVIWEYWLPKAYADYIRYIGVSIEKENPNLCIFEPINDAVNYTKRGLYNQTINAVNSWSEKLEEKAPNGNWRFNITYYLAAEHKDKEVDDLPSCDVYIIYTQYLNNSSTLGQTGFDYSKSWHKLVFINIITDSKGFKLKIEPTDDDDIKAKLEYYDRQLDSNVIGQVIKHELGHALGLSHYVDNTLENKSWDLMKAQIDDKKFNPKIDITDDNIQALIQLYGEDGFGGNTVAKPDKYIVP